MVGACHDKGFCEPNEWALNVKSVIVFGTIEISDELEQIVEVTTKLSHQFTQDDVYIQNEIKHHAHRTLLLILTPEHISGKAVKES